MHIFQLHMAIGWLLLAVFSQTQLPPTVTIRETKLGSLHVTMNLVKRADRTQKELPAGSIQLVSESVKIKKDDTIEVLLVTNGIYPDTEAFAVVYDLNPDLKNLNLLEQNMDLKLPKVKGGAALRAAFQQGYLVALTVDQKLKEKFGENAKKLAGLTSRISAFGTERFASPISKGDVEGPLKNISAFLEKIRVGLLRRNVRPIPSEVLNQLNAETELLNSTLDQIVSSGRKLSASEQDVIKTIEEDIEIKQKAFDEVAAGGVPERYPEVKVIVRPTKQGKEVPDLRVWCVGKGLRKDINNAHSFPRKSPAADRMLNEGKYFFWAARDPGKEPVTNELLQEVRKNDKGEIVIELTVIR